MKVLMLIAMLVLPIFGFAQDQQAVCMKKFDEQLKGAGTEMINVAGSYNYKTLLERVRQCVQAGKCVKADVLVSFMELMVDDKIINIQREKVALLKGYFSKNNEALRRNNYCSILATFPTVMDNIQALNGVQVNRYNELIQQKLDALPKP